MTGIVLFAFHFLCCDTSLCQNHFDKYPERHFRGIFFYLIKQMLWIFLLARTNFWDLGLVIFGADCDTINVVYKQLKTKQCRRDIMVVGFTTTYAISAYHHWSCQFESHSWRVVFDTTSCDKVCQWPAQVQWFSPGPPVSPTNKTDHHDIIDLIFLVL